MLDKISNKFKEVPNIAIKITRSAILLNKASAILLHQASSPGIYRTSHGSQLIPLTSKVFLHELRAELACDISGAYAERKIEILSETEDPWLGYKAEGRLTELFEIVSNTNCSFRRCSCKWWSQKTGE
jgi:hypothetical protein